MKDPDLNLQLNIIIVYLGIIVGGQVGRFLVKMLGPPK